MQFSTRPASAFATGSGTGQPYGIVTALTATTLTSATQDVFAVAGYLGVEL